MERIVAIIPARMGSSRFPGKPLAKLAGQPLIEHVAQRASMCRVLDAVYVATCDDEIRQCVEGFGGAVIMTSPSHERASDRTAEAAASLDAEIIVMIQGDEPLITPEMITAAVTPMLRDAAIGCVNLVKRISSVAEYEDPNTIKVVMTSEHNALYFSRSSIPRLDRTLDEGRHVFKQVCVIPFRKEFLQRYSQLEPTPLEQAESIDMLRAVEHGYHVRLVETEVETHAVDTPEDLRVVESLLMKDPLVAEYSKEMRG